MRPPAARHDGADDAADGVRERYHRLVELAPDAILIHDGERIIMANAAAIRLAGATSRAQILNHRIEEFLPPPYLKGFEALLVAGGAPIPPRAVRDSFRRIDGSLVEVEVTGIPFMEHDRPAAHLVIRDMTESLKAAAELQRAEARTIAAVRTVAGGVAHEVNNMMTVVLGFSDFLRRAPDLSAERQQEVSEIRQAASRAAAVTQQLLTFSRRAVHTPSAVVLDTVAHDALPMIHRLLGDERGLACTFGCPHYIWVDPGQLEQVLANLVLNARDAMPSGGQLKIATDVSLVEEGQVKCVEGFVPAGRYGCLSVRDTGIGMSAEILAQMFQPFFSTKPVGKGTGLGLSVIDGIMEQNGGRTAVESSPGLGSTFTLFFPLVPVSDENYRDAATSASHPTPAGSLVLVVDDEPAMRMLVSRQLTSQGYRVLVAPDGAAALEMAVEHAPDLVLADLNMPVMGGAELLRRLRKKRPGLPILLMSGYSADYLRREGMFDLDEPVVEKPFRPERLMEVIGAALAGRKIILGE